MNKQQEKNGPMSVQPVDDDNITEAYEEYKGFEGRPKSTCIFSLVVYGS